MAKYGLSDRSKEKREVRFRRQEQSPRRKFNAFAMLIVATAICVLVISKQWTKQPDVVAPGKEESEEEAFPDSAAAQQARDYIRAVQENNWARIFETNQWMQRKVEHIRTEDLSDAASQRIEDFYQQEKEDFFALSIGPSLTPDGISDAHLFARGAKARVVDVQEGLSRPILDKNRAVNMVVVEVEYPPSSTAPMTAEEKRVDKLRAALYLTMDGKIVKAGVRGNARVDRKSVLARRLAPSETRRLRGQTGESTS
jgi:hypothetical protein